MHWKSIVILTLVLGLVLPALAQEKSELTVEIVVNADTGLPTRIVVTGTCAMPKAWLGISLYPYGIVDPVVNGRHSFVELSQGNFRQEIQVDPGLLGGSFEVAIWGKRIDKLDCTLEYCYWCKRYGFHLEDMLAYKTGLLTRLGGYQ